MYRDQPQDRVHTLVDELLYPRHPLGWEVAGRENVVLGLAEPELRAFMARGYAPSRIVIALAGKLDTDVAIAEVVRLFGDIVPSEPPRVAPAPRPGKKRLRVLATRGAQAHFCIGWRGVPQGHSDEYTLDMLNAVLGEGMSSRLFLQLRERRGLAYDVHSYDAKFADAGHLVIYAGVAPERVGETITAALAEVARLRDKLVGEEELARVRDFNKGRLELRLEDTRGVSSWLAAQELFLGRVRTVEEVCAIIDGISASDIQRVARTYLRPELAYIAAVGPRAALGAVAAPGIEDEAQKIAS